MEIYPTHCPCHLVETNVVEPFETSTHDLANAVIRYQEVFLPPHEDVLALGAVLIVEIRFLSLLGKRLPGRKARPVLHISFVSSSPARLSGTKGVLWTDYFTFEVGGKGWVVFGQACRL